MLSSRSSCAVLFVLFASLPACAVQPSDSDEPERIGDDSQEIKGGSLATDYPESVLLLMKVGGTPRSLCSGSLIAPSVVITAGHCVHGFDSWTVTAPFAGGQTSSTTNATTFDWNSGSDNVDPDTHDVALVLLDTPITIASYPTIATAALADGASVVNVGRINNGSLSNSALYRSKPLPVKSAADAGYGFDYMASEVIEHGDSGGPVFIPGTHTLVAVNSGGGGGTEILARLDLLHDWIVQQVAAHKGSGTRNHGGDGPGGDESDPVAPAGSADARGGG
jgi:secreted trypsin-like serine protease